MISSLDLQTKIKTRFGDTQEYTSGLRVNCPFCEQSGKEKDTKYHLHICTTPIEYQKRKGFFVHCFRCGYKSTTQRLLSVDLEDFLELYVKPRKKKQISILPETIKPLALSTSMLARKAKRYLKDRKIYNLTDIYYGVGGDWFGRIIFPIRDNGEIVFWTGRSYIDKKPKYKNSNSDKGKHIFNLDKVRQEQQVVICEGVFDALSIRGGVAIFGKKMSDLQFYNFINTIPSNRKVIVGLDPDANLESNDLLLKLSKFYNNLSFIEMSGKDLSESSSYTIIPITQCTLLQRRIS